MMAKPWNEYRGTITKLYIQEGRTLEDVRGIMKNRYNFEASQHFDMWCIGKYNCKKRQERRRQSLNRTILPSPPRSPPGGNVAAGGSSPSSSCASQYSPQQRPLPALTAQSLHYPSYSAGLHHPVELPIRTRHEEPKIKCENSEGSAWEGVDMARNQHVPQPMLPSSMSFPSYTTSANWNVPRSTQMPYLSSPPQEYSRSFYQTSAPRHLPESPAAAGLSRDIKLQSGLRAPNVSGMGDAGPHGSLMHHSFRGFSVGYQGVASG
ncbi:hypothetical protein FALBO_7068 [Fusarium albosuccineum]|uniref:Clr5 domain-containing protein n=1 Tax=Fusarium albosuccineum TaxID=1237068 RepID=A0A8H4PE29_9HYPO|nr:hypothetical protein FALBO_7068 [Fusarium albosuccineum]